MPRITRFQLRKRSLRPTLTIALFVAAQFLLPESGNANEAHASLLPPEQMMQTQPPGSASASASPPRSLTGFRAHVDEGAITVRSSTPTNCLPGDLKGVLAEVAQRYGEVSVQSTHRSPQRNRRAGGASRSLHLECRAIDFRVSRRGRDVMAFLRDHDAVGGLKMYRNGIIHIDNGERRSW
jgi:uncharacterized protein YcbK (DUF882 family)